MTISISGFQRNNRWGNTDPEVNTALQRELHIRRDVAMFKSTKMKIATVINSLEWTFKQMVPGGSKFWWDQFDYSEDVPLNVKTGCYPSYGRPPPRDCEDASFYFIRGGEVTIGPAKPLISHVGQCMGSRQLLLVAMVLIRSTGHCIIEIKSLESQTTKWNGVNTRDFVENETEKADLMCPVVRVVVDNLMSECVERYPESERSGGVALENDIPMPPLPLSGPTAAVPATNSSSDSSTGNDLSRRQAASKRIPPFHYCPLCIASQPHPHTLSPPALDLYPN